MITERRRERLGPEDMRLARVPESYWGARLDDFPDDYDGKREATIYVKKIVKFLQDGAGLVLNGPGGHGKTHMAISILKIAIAHNAYGLFLEAGSLQQAHFERSLEEFEGQSLVERAQSVDLLVLDDLGAEHVSEFSSRLLENLIRHRGNRNRSLLVTTNVIPANLNRTYGPGTVGVLREKCLPVVVHGRDWREDKADSLKAEFE